MSKFPYNTSRWKKLRQAKLMRDPLCAHCQGLDRVVLGKIVDHVKAIRNGGDPFPALDGLQTLCHACHQRKTQSDLKQQETTGGGFDVNGNPIDQHNPYYGEPDQIETPITKELLWPIVRPSQIPLTIIFGPPAVGKTTYVMQNAANSDIVIDLDLIVQEQTGRNHSHTRTERANGLKERNARLLALSICTGDAERAWFITTAPIAATRRQWIERLKPDKALLLVASKRDLLARVRLDPIRRQMFSTQKRIIERWFDTFTPGHGDIIETGGVVQDGSPTGTYHAPHESADLISKIIDDDVEDLWV